MGHSIRTSLLSILLASLASASPQVHDLSRKTTLYAATTDGQGIGAAVKVRGGPPWSTQPLASTDGGRLLRRFGKVLYLVNEGSGTITRTMADGSWSQVYSLGADSEPQDVWLPGLQLSYSAHALVTRRHDSHLHRLNLFTGVGADVLDLSPVGGGYPIALGTMERDGNYLFVQVRVFDGGDTAVPSDPLGDSGVLAVVHLPTLTLVDVELAEPGIQGIALQGAPPHLKMQIIEETRTLFVSTTDDLLDSRGGIEMVNLDTWASTGFALSEDQFSDLGGFVMTSPQGGFFVFHTDLAASTHLKRFTVAGGGDPGPEMLVLLGSPQDVIAYDPRTERIFLPSGSALPSGDPGMGHGIHVFDAISKLRVGSGPIDTGMRPEDVIVQ